MNKVILIGRLVREPEVKTMSNGDYVLANAIAVNRDYTNSQGEREADFINFIAFKKTAETIGKYVRKGHRIGLEGRWQRRSYVNNTTNQTVYVDELIVEKMEFLQDKQEEKPVYNDDPYAGYGNQNNSYQNQRNNGNYQANNQPNNQPKPDPFANVQNQYRVNDDDLPF